MTTLLPSQRLGCLHAAQVPEETTRRADGTDLLVVCSLKWT